MKQMKQTVKGASPHRQKGAVLVFCLVFLGILTLLGVSSMDSSVMEQRQSGNMQDRSLAFQAAESALKDAEAWLATQSSLPITSTDGTTDVWVEESMDPDTTDGKYWWDHANINESWWTTNGNALSDVAKVATQPVYVVEQFRSVNEGQSLAIGTGERTMPRTFHRITSRATGENAKSEVVLQATFVQTYD